MRTRPLALLAVGLLLAPALPATPATAQDRAPEGEREERRVTVEEKDDGVAVSLTPREEEDGEPVEILFTPSNATLTLAHGSGEDRLSLETQLGPLLEYADENGNESYDPGETIVSAWGLEGEADDDDDVNGSVDWRDAIVTDVTEDGTEGKRVSFAGDLGDEGRVELRLGAFGEHASIANGTLTPTGAKIDLSFTSLPFQRNGTGLAMLLTSEASGDREVNRQHGAFPQAGEGLAVTPEGGGAAGLVVAWRDNATTDRFPSPVTTTDLRAGVEDTQRETGPEDEQRTTPTDPNVTEIELALSYPRGDVIDHQFRTDIITSSAQAADESPVPGPGLALFALAFAVAGVRRARP